MQGPVTAEMKVGSVPAGCGDPGSLIGRGWGLRDATAHVGQAFRRV